MITLHADIYSFVFVVAMVVAVAGASFVAKKYFIDNGAQDNSEKF